MDIQSINKQVDVLIREKKFGELADLCRSIISIGEKNLEQEVFYRLSLLGGYALFQQQEFQESIELLKPIHNVGYQEIDVLFLSTANLLLQKKYQEAVTFGEEFLKKIDEIRDKKQYKGLTDAPVHVHEICNNLGTACVKTERQGRAVEFYKKGLGFKKDYSVLYENLAAVYSYDQKWDDVRTIVEEGLSYCPENAELYRIHGVALQNLRKYCAALKSFEKAVDAGSKEAIMELGFLCQRMAKFDDAAKWLEKYINIDPSNSQVVKLYETIATSKYYGRKEPAISAALIVKNEEELLGQCLESIRDVVDEIVVVDTGSEDKTVEIAKNYGAKVFYHPWKDDFSEARNFSISKTSGDWVLIIDADEVLIETNSLNVREVKWNEEYDCFCFAIYSQLPGQLGGVNQGKHYSPRLFKKREDIFYEGIVHNILRMPPKTAMTDIGFYHSGYDLRKDKLEQKFQRSLTLLFKQTEEEPEDPFTRYNLAQMYLSRGYHEEALEHAEKIVEILTPDDKDQIHIYLMGLYQLALIHSRDKNYKKAEAYSLQALKEKPNYIDPMLTLGWIYFDEKRYDEAEKILKEFISTCDKLKSSAEYNMIILNKLASDFEAYYLLGEIYRRQRKSEEALALLEKSVELNPFFWQPFKSLGMLAVDYKNDESAEVLFERAIKLGYLNAEKYGTTGSPCEEYKELLEQYKEVQFRYIDKKHETGSVESALSKIDDFLKRGEEKVQRDRGTK